MINKWGTVICLFLAFTLGGCTLSEAQNPNQKNVVQEKTTQNNELMEGFDKTIVNKDNSAAKDNTDEAHDLRTEVRHWKYGTEQPLAPTSPATPAQPNYPRMADKGTDDGKIISMQFLSGEDIDRIQEVLVQQGYLKDKTRNQEEFYQAVAKFQKGHNLAATGELDAATITLLK